MTGIQLAPPPNEYSDKLAQAMIQQGMDTSGIQSPLQGIAHLAQALAGTYMQGNYSKRKTAYEQQHAKSINDALAAALQTNPVDINQPVDIGQPPQYEDNPLVKAFLAMSQDPNTVEQANQFGVQALMSKGKDENKSKWRDLTQAEKEKRGYNPLQSIQENADTGETRAVGSPQYDPTQVAKTQTTTTRDDRGNLVKRVVGTNKAGDIISTQDLPAVEKAMPVSEQNKVDAVLKAAAISSLFRDIITEGSARNWTGPISGPMTMKAQALGFNDVGGDWAKAFAAAKEHYKAALNGLIPQRGKYILDVLDKMGPSAAYSPERNLLQLSMTEGLLRGVAANTVKGYANTEYHIDPDLFTLARQAGFDPADPHSAKKDYLPTFTDTGNAPKYQEGQTATGPNGKKIIFRNGKWVDMKTGAPYGG